MSDSIIQSLSNSKLYSELLDLIKKIYENDKLKLGFSRTCGILSIKNEFVDNFSRQSCCLITPLLFPANELAEYIMQEIHTNSLVKINCIDVIGKEFLTNSPNDKQKIIAYNFERLDWGSQRALLDVCTRHKIPLIVIIQTKTKYNEYRYVSDYDLDLEVGVTSRLSFAAINFHDNQALSNKIDTKELEASVLDKNNWAKALFPFNEILSRLPHMSR